MENKKAFIAISTVIILIIFFSVETNNFLSSIKTKKEEIYKENEKILDSIIRIEKDRLKSIAIQLSLSSMVKKSLRENNSSIIENELYGTWKRLKDASLLTELHFFIPPSISFVNFNNFDSAGDDTRDFRGDVFWALSAFQSSEHLLVCRSYPGIRATYPVEVNGSVVGGVSVGKAIDYIPRILKEDFDKNSILAYNQDSFKTMAKPNLERFAKTKTVTDKLFIDMESFPLSDSELKKVEFGEGKEDLKLNGKRYFVTSYPIEDFHKETLAYIAIFNDLDSYYEAFYIKELKNLFLFLIGIAIAFAILNKRLQAALNTIKNLSAISNSFKNNDFSGIKNKTAKEYANKESKDEIEVLSNNIYEMGCYIRDHYEELQNKIDKKTKELLDTNKKLEDRFYTDTLTELRNLNGLIYDIKQCKAPILAIIKLVNQSTIKALYGIEAGEYILKEIAQLLKKAIISNSIKVYRIESNRFAILAEDMPLRHFYGDILKDIVYNIEHLTYYYKESEIEIETDTLVGLCEDGERFIVTPFSSPSKTENAISTTFFVSKG